MGKNPNNAARHVAPSPPRPTQEEVRRAACRLALSEGLACALLLALVGTGACVPYLGARAYHAEVTAVAADEPDIHYWSRSHKPGTHPLREDAKIVVVKYHTWIGGRFPPLGGPKGEETECEILDTRVISAAGAELEYPCRLYWLVLMPGLLAGYCHYPGVIAFTEAHWPTIISVSSVTSYTDHDASTAEGEDAWVYRLVFYPRTFRFDQQVAKASGLRAEAGSCLTSVLRRNLRGLIRSVERSKELSPSLRAMVFRQLLALIEHDRRVLRGPPDRTADDDVGPVYDQAERKLREALARTGAAANAATAAGG